MNRLVDLVSKFLIVFLYISLVLFTLLCVVFMIVVIFNYILGFNPLPNVADRFVLAGSFGLLSFFGSWGLGHLMD